MRTTRTQAGIAVILALASIHLLSPRLLAQDLLRDARVSEAVNLLDRWVEAQQAYEQFPSISLALVHDQTLLWAKGFGHADVESGRPATPETIYGICSISKLFTSVAAMRLVDQGAVELDAPIGRVLPWFEVGGDTIDTQRVSLRSLLTHTAGLDPDIGTPPDSAPYLYNATREELRSLLPKEGLRHRPGASYTYSNVGMALVGEIVEAASGRPFAKYVDEQILVPLRMFSTRPEIGDIAGSEMLAVGYGPPRRGGGRTRVGSFKGNAMVPSRGFSSTVLDLARFSSWQFRLLNGSDEIIEATTLRDMYRGHFVDSIAGVSSGLGFTIYGEGPETTVGHSGTCPGYRTALEIDPERRLAAVALANSMIPVWRYTSRAHALVAPAITAALSDPAGQNPTPPEFQRYVGTYEGFPWSGEWQVIPWKGSLATIRFPIDDPLRALRPLKHIGAADFRVIEDDGSLGMEVTFESNASGSIVRMITNNYPRPRLP